MPSPDSPSNDSYLRIRRLTKKFGEFTALADISLDVLEGEFVCFLGQRVRLLVDGFQAAGAYRVHWDARDQRGAAVAAGVYLARLIHPGGASSRRLLYLE